MAQRPAAIARTGSSGELCRQLHDRYPRCVCNVQPDPASTRDCTDRHCGAEQWDCDATAASTHARTASLNDAGERTRCCCTATDSTESRSRRGTLPRLFSAAGSACDRRSNVALCGSCGQQHVPAGALRGHQGACNGERRDAWVSSTHDGVGDPLHADPARGQRGAHAAVAAVSAS